MIQKNHRNSNTDMFSVHGVYNLDRASPSHVVVSLCVCQLFGKTNNSYLLMYLHEYCETILLFL